MASFVAHLANAILRRAAKPALTAAADLEAATGALSLRLPALQRHGGARRIGESAGVWFDARGKKTATLLYLHGGAYFVGPPGLHRPILSAFAGHGFDVFAPAYRLAPLHPFPAAVDDARQAYLDLRAHVEGPVVVAGDSAGGGLALALMIALRDAGETLPEAAVLFSPWTDLLVTGASTRENEARDALFTRRMLKIAARNYLQGANAKNPLASPLYGDLAGLPPLLVHTGADEVLRDDSTRLIERAQAAGVDAQLKLWPVVPHVWQLATPLMPEARASLSEAAEFLRAQVAA